MGNKENQGKLKSIIKFFQDVVEPEQPEPGAYLLFGNGLLICIRELIEWTLVWGAKFKTVIPRN